MIRYITPLNLQPSHMIRYITMLDLQPSHMPRDQCIRAMCSYAVLEIFLCSTV